MDSIDCTLSVAEQAWYHDLHRRDWVVRETLERFPGVARERIERLYEHAVAERVPRLRPRIPADRLRRTHPTPEVAFIRPPRLRRAAPRVTIDRPSRDWATLFAAAGIVLAMLGVIDHAAHAGSVTPAPAAIVVAGK